MTEDSYLFLSGHDYGTPRKANIHFLAQEARLRGRTRVFSMGFSPLTRFKLADPRRGMEALGNKLRVIDGVECYLWSTPLHPFNPRIPALQACSPLAFEAYRALRPPVLTRWIKEARVIFVESGLQVLFLRDIKAINPEARVIYIASDDLSTIGVDPYLIGLLSRSERLIDGVHLPSTKLAGNFPGWANVFLVPHGISKEAFDESRPDPFGGRDAAVSVGPMLFDPNFFWVACEMRPELEFHVIGPGVPREALPPGVHFYDQLPFEQTISYLQHARVGVAPYRREGAPYYLGDTSMKLMQYGYLGLPAVCPDFCLSILFQNRFPYGPRDKASIGKALDDALSAPKRRANSFLTWGEALERMLYPSKYPDTVIHGLR